MTRVRVCLTVVMGLLGACEPQSNHAKHTVVQGGAYQSSRIVSFTDTFSIGAAVDGGPALWAATNQGLLRWDIASSSWSVFTNKDGLPAGKVLSVTTDREGAVWVATTGGVARGTRTGWKAYPPAPVGEFIVGMAASLDRDELWAAGPRGFARLRDGAWKHFFDETPTTAMTLAPSGEIWIGTSGHGVLRIPRSGDAVEQFGPPEGCDPDGIRAVVATKKWVFAVGENSRGARAAVYDGTRFWSFTLSQSGVAAVGPVLEWAVRGGDDVYAGKDQTFYRISFNEFPADAHEGAVRFDPIGAHAVGPRMAPLQDGISSKIFDTLEHMAPKVVTPKLEPGQKAPPPPTGPLVYSVYQSQKLPEGILSVSSGDRGALVGTRFRGMVRIENGLLRHFATNDLSAGADRITVACMPGTTDDCFLATGGSKAWRFDGSSFTVADVDPEPGSRVLAVVRDSQGAVMAIHRGAKDSLLRISRVDSGRWSPIGMQGVSVPVGAPDLNFAQFAPDGKLWIGLRYTDHDKDTVDFGAAELDLGSGKAKYHRLDPALPEAQQLPNNVVALAWRGSDETWFATRSGAARIMGGKLTMYTENEGLEDEVVRDIVVGERNEIWVATHKGTGRWDGAKWHFDKLGGFYLPSNALGRDEVGHTFIGTEKGLYCEGACADDVIDAKRGLVDDNIMDLAVDGKRRVWVLTAKGVSIVEP